MKRGPVSPDARADFSARLEYGLNPVVELCGEHAWSVAQGTFLCENGNGPGGAGNTTRSLTHDLPQQEGAGAMVATSHETRPAPARVMP